MGARAGFADVLISKLADVPPPAAPGLQASRIASPAWVLRLEPLRVASASVLHMRYPHLASAAPAAGGIPTEPASSVACGGSQAPSPSGSPSASGRWAVAARPVVPRGPRERLAIQIFNRLGADLDATASDADVRRAYRQLVRDSHPDLHQSEGAAGLDRHAQRLRTVLRAWHLFVGRECVAA